jgi:hypothetical protein
MSIDPRIVAGLITEDPDVFISESGFNNSGVPHYANKDTPAVRPQAPEFKDTTNVYVGTKATRQRAMNMLGVSRTKDMVGKRVYLKEGGSSVFYGPCTIASAFDQSVTLKPDNSAVSLKGSPGRMVGIGWYAFVEFAEPLEERNNIRDYSFDELD